MRIINLVENEIGAAGCEAAHGLSFYVETENHNFLFDTGGGRSTTAIPLEQPNHAACGRASEASPSELMLRNARMLGVDLSAVDTVILSHGHYDHSGGILPFAELNPNAKIYMQNNASGKYYAYDGEEKGYRYIGIDNKILELPQVQLLHGDTKLDEEIQIFTVDKRAFPQPSTNKRLLELRGGQYIQDDFLHEQNLLLTTCGKKILFCGCAHNGILNVLETLERKFGAENLPDLVLGGFHLMKRTDFSEADTAEVTEIASRLKSYKAHFATCHCTGLTAFNQMKKIMGEQLSYVCSGDEVLVGKRQ